jgi:hypothetical protein
MLVVKNVNKIGVLAGIAILLFVFCCKDSKIARSPLPIPKECESLFPKQEVNFDFSRDSAVFMECYAKHNGNKNIECNESGFNEYSVCAIIHPKIFGFPRECLDFAKQKDSVAYYACCRKYNACWLYITDKYVSHKPEQQKYNWIDSNQYSIEDLRNDPELPFRRMEENRKKLISEMGIICNGNEEKYAYICKDYEKLRKKIEQKFINGKEL